VTGFPALDVALGLSFVYFLLSTTATAVTEIISRAVNWRARTLEKWLGKTLKAGADPEALDAFCKSPLISVLRLSSGKKRGQRAPAYIPSRHFVAAVLDAGHTAEAKAAAAVTDVAGLRTRLTSGPIKDTEVGKALNAVLDHVGDDAKAFRLEAETWFDDQMERLSGVYKRWTQLVSLGIGVVVVALLQADSIRMAVTLWRDPAARDVVAAQAASASSSVDADAALEQVDRLPLPLGWGNGFVYGDSLEAALMGLLGGLITVGSIYLGAPFWFDAMSRIARIRSTGAPPPATDAVRRGDGEQTRAGAGTIGAARM